MPHNMGHNDGVNCMIMAEGKIFSGGRDENLFVWRPERSPSGEMQWLGMSYNYGPAAWLFPLKIYKRQLGW